MSKLVFHALLTVATVFAVPSLAVGSSDFVEVYVQDFHSEESESCTNVDVFLSHAQARQFFIRSRQVSSRVIRDRCDEMFVRK